MKCLDHIDMAVMAGAVTVVAGAAFFFAYLGVERQPLVSPAPISSEAMIQEELAQAMTVAQAIPARATLARERTQAALGKAIVRLGQAQVTQASFISDVTERAEAEARREFLRGVFRLPADWRGAEFARKERAAEAGAQQELGGRIVEGRQAVAARVPTAEEGYGMALLAATQAIEREPIDTTAAQSTIFAATTAIGALAEQRAPVPPPEIARDPSWGFGSIGDGVFLPIAVFGGGAMLLLAAGFGMAERDVSTRTMEAYCETAGKDVEITMLVAEDTPYEVTRCSAFNGGPVTCDKHCLKWETARAAA